MTPVRAGDVVPINVGRYNQLFILRADPQGPGVDVPGAPVTLEALRRGQRHEAQVAPGCTARTSILRAGAQDEHDPQSSRPARPRPRLPRRTGRLLDLP